MKTLLTTFVIISFFLTAAAAAPTSYQTVILHPTGFTESCAWGAFGAQQVGYGYETATSILSTLQCRV